MMSKLAAKEETAPAPQPIQIVVVDDNIFMRELIVTMLKREGGRYRVLDAVGTADAAITTCAKFSPDLLILDINLPDRSGIDIVPEIKRTSRATKVLLCTSFPTAARVVDALRAGADGFVEKTNTWDDFIGAVDRVGRGEQYFSSKSNGIIPQARSGMPVPRPKRPSEKLLSPREHEVLRLIARGKTSKEIAGDLFISSATVDTHRVNLMGKLDVHNAASLVLYAFQNGLVDTCEAPRTAT